MDFSCQRKENMNILDELYAGNIQPNDGTNVSKAYNRATNEQIKCYENLSKSLSEKEKRTLDKMIDCFYDMEYEFGNIMFKQGFSIGLQLASECYREKNC